LWQEWRLKLDESCTEASIVSTSDQNVLRAAATGLGPPSDGLVLGDGDDIGISIVVPIFNEVQVLPAFHGRLTAVLQPLGIRYEMIYVDDGSTDGSGVMLSDLQRSDPAVGLMRLSRNFGKELALSAGLRATSGACVVVLDADLQDPPELIPQMLAAWRKGSDVVSMRRRSRQGETWFKATSAHFFYRLLNRLSDVPVPTDVGDFRLISRRVVVALNQMPERNRYMKGLFAWVGFSQVTLEYDRDARAAGVAKQNYWRLWALAVDGITSFSVVPLRITFVVGLMAASTAMVLTAFYAIKALVFGDAVQGFPTLIVAILSLGGLNLLGLGVIGEYLGRLFMEAKRRPLFFIDEFTPPQVRLAKRGTPPADVPARPDGSQVGA
jgi:glycosyltransferase involved in cell wall biosynthesis